MIEKDLKTYGKTLRIYKGCQEALTEFTVRIRSPKTQTISFVPFSESNGESDLPYKIDQLVKLEKARDAAKDKLDGLTKMLAYVFNILDRPTEKEFLLDHYLCGLRYDAIEKKRKRSRTSLFRDRASILAQIANITFVY